jgi:hypothetical protein
LRLELVNLQYGIDGTNAEGQQVSEEFALKSRAVATRAIFLTWKDASSLPISPELKVGVETKLTRYLEEAKLFFENNSIVDYTW